MTIRLSQLEVTRIDLNTMLQQQLAGFYPLMEEKGIRLQLHLADHMEISGDFDKLQRVFDNLMRNAINYSIPQTEIRIAGMLYEDGVCLTYSNEGEAWMPLPCSICSTNLSGGKCTDIDQRRCRAGTGDCQRNH